jgi:hypothetical protein
LAFADDHNQPQQAPGVIDTPRPTVFFGQTHKFIAINVHQGLVGEVKSPPLADVNAFRIILDLSPEGVIPSRVASSYPAYSAGDAPGERASAADRREPIGYFTSRSFFLFIASIGCEKILIIDL